MQNWRSSTLSLCSRAGGQRAGEGLAGQGAGEGLGRGAGRGSGTARRGRDGEARLWRAPATAGTTDGESARERVRE
jgi:hypothetical protein